MSGQLAAVSELNMSTSGLQLSGAGNPACSRLSGGFSRRTRESFARTERRLKAGGSQDWPPYKVIIGGREWTNGTS
jgi:hypothetical protein